VIEKHKEVVAEKNSRHIYSVFLIQGYIKVFESLILIDSGVYQVFVILIPIDSGGYNFFKQKDEAQCRLGAFQGYINVFVSLIRNNSYWIRSIKICLVLIDSGV